MRTLATSMLAVMLLSTIQAEIRMVYPRPQLARSNMTEAPCCDGFDRSFQEEYTEITPGALTIRWEETVPRPGSPMRISIIDIDKIDTKCVLLDHIPHNSNSRPTPSEKCSVRDYPIGECTNSMNYLTVDIPDVRCDRCVMQLMSVVTNGYDDPCVEDENGIVNCTTFYSCSNIKIIPTAAGVVRNTTDCMTYPGASAKKWPYLQHVMFEAKLDMPDKDPQPFTKDNFVRLYIKNDDVSFDINLATPRLNIVNNSVVIVNPENGIVLNLVEAMEVSPMRFKSYKTPISDRDKQFMENGQLYIRMTDDQGNALEFGISHRMEKFVPGVYREHSLPYSKNGWLSGRYFVGDYAKYPMAIYPAGPSQPKDTHQYVSILRATDGMVKGVVAYSLSGEIVSIKAFVDGKVEAMYLGSEDSSTSHPIGYGSIKQGRVMGTEHIGKYMKSISGKHPSQVISRVSVMNISMTFTSPVQRGMKAIIRAGSKTVGLAVVTFDNTNSFMITLVLDNTDGLFSQNTNITLNGPVTSSGSAPVLVDLSGDNTMFSFSEKSLILEKRIHLEKTFFPLYLWSGYLYIDVITEGLSSDGFVSGQIHRLTNAICDGIDSIACSSRIALSDNSSVANPAVVPVQAEAVAYVSDNNETLSWGIILRGLKRSETVEYVALMQEDVVLVEYRDAKMLSEMFRPATGEDQVLIGQGKITLSMDSKRVLQNGLGYFAIGTDAFVENQNIKTSLRGELPALSFVDIDTDVTLPETATTRPPQQPTRIPRTSPAAQPDITEAPSPVQPVVTDAPSTAPPVVTEEPSTAQPAVTDAPSSTQPVVTEGPSTAQPVVTEGPSTDQPVETERPSPVQPIVTNEPSTVQPDITEGPPTAQPVVTDEPSTAQPVVTEGTSPVQPIVTVEASTAQPSVTEGPSTAQPLVTNEPSTPQPVVTEGPSPVQPIVTEEPSTAQPVVTEEPSTAQPVVTDAPSTVQPVVTEGPSTDQPVETERPSPVQPIVTNEPSTVQPDITEGPPTAQPVVTEGTSPVQPIVTVEASTAQPSVTEGSSTAQPLVTNEPSTPQPVVTEGPSPVQPIVTDEPSTAQPLVTNEPSTPQPVVTAGPSPVQPIVTNEPSTVQPDVTEGPPTAQPVVTDEPSTAQPVVTDEPSTAQPVVTEGTSPVQPIVTVEASTAQPSVTEGPSTAQPLVTNEPSTPQPVVTEGPSPVQPIVTEEPSTAQPVETDEPSTAQPVVTDEPSTAQPIVTEGPPTAQPAVTDDSTIQPSVTEGPSTVQPVVTEGPSSVQPVVAEGPSTVQPVVTEGPSPVQPIVTDEPSTAQPVVTDEPSTAQPVATEGPSPVQPIVTDASSTAQPVVTDEPSTALPVVTDEPSTAQPVVTDETSTAQPVATEGPSPVQPIVTDASSTAQPVVTDEPSTVQPVVTDEPSTAQPVVTDEPSTAQPVVTEGPSTAQPVVTDVSVVTEAPTTAQPVVTDAPSTARPVITDAQTTARPVVTDAQTTARPVVTDAPTTARPVVTDAPTTARPVLTDAPPTARPVVTDAPTTARPVTTDAPTTVRRVVTDTPTRVPTATPRPASPSTTRRLPTTVTTRRQFVNTASPLQTTVKSITTSPRRTGSETAFKCLQAGLFADPFDCNAFHMCVGMNYKNYFIDYKMACPVSLVFDDNMDRCQWPQLAKHVSCNYDEDKALP